MTIHTKLHEAQATAERGRTVGPHSDTIAAITAMADMPHYVLDGQLADALDRDPLTKSLCAMQEAGVLRLPFPRVCMELWDGMANQRLLCIVEEDEKPGEVKIAAVEWNHTPSRNSLSIVFRADFKWRATPAPGATIWPPYAAAATPEGSGFLVVYDHAGLEKAPRLQVEQIGLGLMLLYAMTHLAGIEREVIESSKLNRHRIRLGKTPIPTHSVVRIGHVYGSDGRKVSINAGNRRSMPIHMRAAHTRMQPHGEKWLAEHRDADPASTHHLVFIEAVLINFKDGTDLDKPLPKLVKF